MTMLEQVAVYTDALLDTAKTPDYPHALNGVQLENRAPLRGIAAAVDFSTRAIQGTIASNANLLLVHHGMFWSGLEPIAGPAYRRLQLLFEHDIAVYASHLPLDRHPSLGNNTLLAKELGLSPTGPFAHHDEISLGLSGECDIETETLALRAQNFARSYGGDARTSRIPKKRCTKRWAICTGAGASTATLHEAVAMGVDTLIVGEGPHWTAIFGEEHDLAVIYAGHYATETLGIRALAAHLGEKFDLPSYFLSLPTGL